MGDSSNESKKGSVIEALLVYLTRTRPVLLFIHLIFMIVASLALSTSYILAFHFAGLMNIYQEAHNIHNFSSNLRLSARQDQEINSILSGVLEGTGSNRVYVFRYHNSLAAVNGVPFFFQTLTHEVIRPGATRMQQFKQNVPSSINLGVNMQFMQNRCALISNTAEDPSNQNYWYFQTRGAVDLVRCPIFMPNGDLFAFVGVDFTSDVEVEQLDSTAKVLREAASAIVAVFLARR